MYKVNVLADGYSFPQTGSSLEMKANGTSSLIVGPNLNMIVDTLSPWDKDLLIEKLHQFQMTPDKITHVVCTHGHPDHIGNNNLFTHAKLHIVGHSVYHADEYYENGLHEGDPYRIDQDNLYVLPTPGHTLDSVSVVVKTRDAGTVCIAGDLFEKEGDLKEEALWREAGSEDEGAQRRNRRKVLLLADVIVPGHGAMFAVTEEMRDKARKSRV